MKHDVHYVFFLLISAISMNAQQGEEALLPYHSIPAYPDAYTPGTVVARMIDGLGYRYFWATSGLNDQNLGYRPVEGSRSVLELIRHIHGLSETILNAALKQANDRSNAKEPPKEFALLRQQTLKNLKTASELMAMSTDLREHPLIFIGKKERQEYPFWHQINGPIEDAVWHCGQLATLRRANGNPLPPGVNVFTGQTKK